MEIKKEDLEAFAQDIKLLTNGSNLKKIILDDPESPSKPGYRVILQKYQPALDRVKQYIEEWTITSDLFQNTFPDFYKKHDGNITRTSKTKIHTSYHNKDQKKLDPNITASHEINTRTKVNSPIS